MAYDESNTRAKEIDIWNANGAKSFVKCQTDWFSGSNPDHLFDSRLHLSFVEHSGKQNNCKQLKHIEMGIPMVKAGGDGKNSGTTALGLAADILSGKLGKLASKSLKDAAANNQKYASEIWSCIGGTVASRSKDGKAEFRKISIAPGAKLGTYVFKASRCEGDSSGSMGGVSPKKDAVWETITVPVDSAYMNALGEVILTEWQAFRTALATQKLLANQTMNQKSTYANAPAPAPAPVQAPVQNSAPATTPAPAPVNNEPRKYKAMIYLCGQIRDGKTTPVGFFSSAKAAVKVASDWMDKAYKETGGVAKPGNWDAFRESLKTLIRNKEDGYTVLLSLTDPHSSNSVVAYLSVAVMNDVEV